MLLVPKLWHWQALTWWAAVLSATVLLKHHYSIASVVELEWIFRPLSLLLEWSSGYSFYRDGVGQWFSEAADVRLVKACAGINFMLMSLLAYAWVFRPGRQINHDRLSWLSGRMLLFFSVIIAAWLTCLLANALRITVAMNLNDHGPALHRMIGMAIYVPLLSLQLSLGNRGSYKEALAGPVFLYLLLMVVVPLLTGNAFQNPSLFIEHLWPIFIMMALMVGAYFISAFRR